MLSDNKYRIKGRFKTNPDLRENENGTKYTMFTLAVKKYSLKNGKIDYNTCIYLNFKAWSGLAERICREGKKGDRIWVEGEIDMYVTECACGIKHSTQVQLVQDFEIIKLSFLHNIKQTIMGILRCVSSKQRKQMLEMMILMSEAIDSGEDIETIGKKYDIDSINNNGDDLKDIPNNIGEPYFTPEENDDYRPPFDFQ